jgi:isopentenyl diphosphate isomerase/L-lactate dehydrogenase-like FMN-dependent dehydrogenase
MAGAMLQALEDEARGLHPGRLSEKIEHVQTQLRLACFLTGSKSAKDLQKLPIL